MTEGFITKRHNQPVKRYCRMLDIVNDAEAIRRYRECHDKEHAWSEIRDGIKQVGILEMEMYILDNHVFMIVDTPLDFDWDTAMARLATLPRQQEWEAFVSAMQGCDPTAEATDKWKMMDRMFYLYD